MKCSKLKARSSANSKVDVIVCGPVAKEPLVTLQRIKAHPCLDRRLPEIAEHSDGKIQMRTVAIGDEYAIRTRRARWSAGSRKGKSHIGKRRPGAHRESFPTIEFHPDSAQLECAIRQPPQDEVSISIGDRKCSRGAI